MTCVTVDRGVLTGPSEVAPVAFRFGRGGSLPVKGKPTPAGLVGWVASREAEAVRAGRLPGTGRRTRAYATGGGRPGGAGGRAPRRLGDWACGATGRPVESKGAGGRANVTRPRKDFPSLHTSRSHPVITLNEGHVAEAPRTRRPPGRAGDQPPGVAPARVAKSPGRAGDQSPRVAPARVAKSKDASKIKVSFYLDAQTAEKLGVAAIIRRADQSDVANEILARGLSSVTYYDRSAARAAGEPLTVTQVGQDAAAG